MTGVSVYKKLPRDFYKRPVLEVAPDLLGKIFVKAQNGKITAGRIVEVEAYDGSVDEASHTFIGKTKRNSVMFGPGGFLYVYFTYGMYHCCNVVTGFEGSGTAALIRGIEPLTGIEILSLNRFGRSALRSNELIKLTNGPGKVCMAFNINRDHNGLDLLGNEIFLALPDEAGQFETGTSGRIGIKKSVELEWRFFIKNNPYVSR